MNEWQQTFKQYTPPDASMQGRPMLNGTGNFNNTIATAPVTPGSKTFASLSNSVS